MSQNSNFDFDFDKIDDAIQKIDNALVIHKEKTNEISNYLEER